MKERKKETKPRRTKGDGAITKIESKDLWRGTIECGIDENGKKITKTFYDKSRPKLVAKMKEFRIKTFGLKIDKSTFEIWTNRFLELKKNSLNPKSYQRYEGIVDHYISKADFYETDIQKIVKSDIELFYSQLKELGATYPTIYYTHLRIKSIFNLAKDDEVILRNPTDKIKMAKPEVSETLVKAWSKEEQKKFTDYIIENDHKYKNLYLLALGSGLRLGELLSLTWNDIDLKNKTVTVNKTASRLRQADKTYKDVITEPKSKSSNRTVPIPNSIIEHLKTIEKSDKTNLVFYDPNTFSFIFNKNPNKNITYITKKIGIPDMTFHHLRSTYATRLFEAGVQLKTVQKLLGHGTLQMTERIYVQVMKDTKIESVNKIDNLFS